jgi:hypothetical protein
MTYTQVFGGNTIYPSDVSYRSIALSANIELEWPLETAAGVNVAARIIDVTASAAGYYVDLPDATLTGAGQVILFNNVGATYSFFVRDFMGGTLATIAPGQQWELYLAATTTSAGTWRVFRFGASTATVQPSALAGAGLTVDGSTLAQSTPVSSFSTSPQTLSSSNRASAFVWTGSGTGTLNLPSTVTVGNNYFVMVRNQGGGALVIDPAGAEQINSLSTVSMQPGDSATLITDGVSWFTIGLGQNAVFAFDYTIIDIPAGTSTLTLSGQQLNRIAYRFTSSTALNRNCTIIVPSTVQQYWVTNATSGAYTLSLSTSGGTPVSIAQNARGIYYCDGSNIILADTASVSLPVGIAQGGTGATTDSAARFNLGITPFADPLVTSTSAPGARAVISAAASGANSDITSLSGLTTPLSVAQGGTGANTLTSGYLVKGNGTSAASASVVYDNGTNVGIGTATPGAKLTVRATTDVNHSFSYSGAAATYLAVNNAASGYVDWLGYANTFQFNTASTERMRIDAGGNVGIGATSITPIFGRTLQIASGSTEGSLSIVGSTGAGFVSTNSSAFYVTGRTGMDLVLGTNDTEKMRITSAGKVGIGTAAPWELLSIPFGNGIALGNSTYSFKIQRSSAGELVTTFSDTYDAASAKVEFTMRKGAAAENTPLSIYGSGNVAIGQNSPLGRFSVSSATGSVGFNTGTSVSPERGNIWYDTDGTGWKLNIGKLQSGTFTPQMTFQTNGNIGIGTTSPGASYKLDIVNAGAVSARVYNTASNAEASYVAGNSVGATIFGINSGGQFIYTAAAIPTLFISNNTEMMRISAAGDVGIGTSSPSEKLDVRPSANNVLQVTSASHGTLSGLSAATAYSRGNDGVTGLAAVFGWNNGGLAMAGREGLVFATGGSTSYSATTERMRIDTSGNVGIGTSSPAVYSGFTTLDIDNATNGGLLNIKKAGTTVGYINGSSGMLLLANATDLKLNATGANTIQLTTNGSERMRITSAGNVGIGTTSPACSLDVTGGIKTSRATVTAPASTDGNIFSGTYTPTGYTGTNTTVVTPLTCQYMRVGNVVTVSGRAQVTVTSSSTASEFSLSLPIASDLITLSNCSGTFTSGTNATNGCVIGDPTNDRAFFQMFATNAGSQPFTFSFTYQII